MANDNLNWIANFIWGIADDVLRDVYVRGKYRDVILPMIVIRRLDAVLEPTKKAVLEMKARLDAIGIASQDAPLRDAAAQAFYNTSLFTLRDLAARAKAHQLRADFEAYLDGFSPNVQEILDKFRFRNQIQTLIDADRLGLLIEKFLDRNVNLAPVPAGSLPALDNHAMGTIFEELIRRFNEENNEEAGEHFTPRDVVRLMAELIFLPIADQIRSGTYLVYDGACGTGGMLTVAEQRLQELATQHGQDVAIHLFGQEVNAETYAITKADLLLKGEGEQAEHIAHGSTLSQDAFPSREFDFMLSNPPYGKSWKAELERLGGKSGIRDPRFVTSHADDPDFSMVTRSSDGQLLFLLDKLAKMKRDTPGGSRIAEVHNGSSLFTGDAGQGESNIRRWILENDWLEAIIALPLNMFYNTGIATYIWVLSNRKPAHRRGRVQLLDATQWSQPLRKNLGNKNCELSPANIRQIVDAFLKFEETEQSRIFPNQAFGYWKIVVERPLRLRSQFTTKAIESLRYQSGDEDLRRTLYSTFGPRIYTEFAAIRDEMEQALTGEGEPDGDTTNESSEQSATAVPEKRRKKLLDAESWNRDHALVETARTLAGVLSDQLYEDHNVFRARFDDAVRTHGLRLSAADRKLILRAVSWRDENAPPVVASVLKAGKSEPDPLYGRFAAEIEGKPRVLEYEPDSDLRDTEQVPLLEDGGIEAFFRREVLPHVADAWIQRDGIRIGYEISFTRYFYKPVPMRSLQEIREELLALEKESEGLLSEVLIEVEA